MPYNLLTHIHGKTHELACITTLQVVDPHLARTANSHCVSQRTMSGFSPARPSLNPPERLALLTAYRECGVRQYWVLGGERAVEDLLFRELGEAYHHEWER